MKKLALILSIIFMMVPRVFSYSIITDPDLFYSFFEKPMTTIDFKVLKDGTSYESIRFRIRPDQLIGSQPPCPVFGHEDIHLAGSDNQIIVRSDAFSDAWSFRAADPKMQEVSCDAVIWFNQGISAGQSRITVTSSSGLSEPFVLYTNKGFMGVVPDSPRETVFIFDSFSAVFGFETDFLRPSTTLNTTRSFISRLDIN